MRSLFGGSAPSFGALFVFVMTLVITTEAPAQISDTSSSGPLYSELAQMDSILFDVAFVTCDAARFRALWTEDAEFYHDQVAPSFGAEVSTLNGCPRDRGVRRILVPGSLRVYPIAEFGAIQMGEHRFVEGGAPSATIAKFVHLWSNRDDEWRMARVLSFDHKTENQ